MKKLVALALILGLTACTSAPVVYQNRYLVIQPTDDMYTCPTDYTIPPADPMQSDAARNLNELRKNNATCKTSLNGIKEFLDKEAKKYDELNKKAGVN